MPVSVDLSGRRIVIITHVLKYSVAEDLLRFLNENHADRTLFIGHPLEYVPDRPGSECREYVDGKVVRSVRRRDRRLPGPVRWLYDSGRTLAWVCRTRTQWDLIIAYDNLNAAAALFLKRVGLAKRVVYYTIDFVPQRFDSRLLDRVYHWVDSLCVNHADVTWNVSDEIAIGRETVRGQSQSQHRHQVTVPIGAWVHELPHRRLDEIEPQSLVYSGGLLPHQGLSLVLDAVLSIREALPDFRLYVTGMGPIEGELKEQTHRLGIDESIRFMGYLESHGDLHQLLSRCAAGVAMYSAQDDVWSRFADPSKIKLYLSMGLPVFTTGVTYIAPELERRKAGFLLKYEPLALANAVIGLLSDANQLEFYRSNAQAFGAEFDWPVIFAPALSDARLGLQELHEAPPLR